MGGVDIREELANDIRLNEDVVIVNQDRHQPPRVQLEEVGGTRAVHVDDPLLEWYAQLGECHIGAICP